MARIEGLSKKRANIFTRFLYWMTKRKVGKVIEPVTITAYHNGSLMGLCLMEMAQMSSKSVESSLKELVQVKAAMQIGCPF